VVRMCLQSNCEYKYGKEELAGILNDNPTWMNRNHYRERRI